MKRARSVARTETGCNIRLLAPPSEKRLRLGFTGLPHNRPDIRGLGAGMCDLSVLGRTGWVRG